MKRIAIAMAFVLGSLSYAAHEAAAYTISAACVETNQPPAGTPVENTICTYAWQQGGDAMAIHGKWISTLFFGARVIPGLSPPVHTLQRERFNLNTNASPNRVWIKCTNRTGYHAIEFQGWLYKYFVGTLNSPGYWEPVDFKLDWGEPYVTQLVPCS